MLSVVEEEAMVIHTHPDMEVRESRQSIRLITSTIPLLTMEVEVVEDIPIPTLIIIPTIIRISTMVVALQYLLPFILLHMDHPLQDNRNRWACTLTTTTTLPHLPTSRFEHQLQLEDTAPRATAIRMILHPEAVILPLLDMQRYAVVLRPTIIQQRLLLPVVRNLIMVRLLRQLLPEQLLKALLHV